MRAFMAATAILGLAAIGLPLSGNVEGVVLWNEQPVPGAHVYATSEYSFQSIHYGDARADADGHFTIRNVPPGQKYLYAFGTRSEYWVSAVTPFTMPPDTGVVAPPTYLCKGFDASSPARDAIVTTKRPTLAWPSYPTAVDYAVRVLRDGERSFIFSRGDRDAHVTATSVAVDIDLPNGSYNWRVDAFNRAGHIIGCSFYPRPFLVRTG
jgi:hypothetical protein